MDGGAVTLSIHLLLLARHYLAVTATERLARYNAAYIRGSSSPDSLLVCVSVQQSHHHHTHRQVS